MCFATEFVAKQIQLFLGAANQSTLVFSEILFLPLSNNYKWNSHINHPTFVYLEPKQTYISLFLFKKSKYLCFWKHIISELGLIYMWQSTEAENKCEDFTQSASGNKGWRWMGECKHLFIMVPSNSKFNYEALLLRQFAFKISHWSLKFWWKTFFFDFHFLI